MASGKSNYLSQALLNGVLGGPAFSVPANVYIALFTDANTAAQRSAGTVTEVVGNGYTRISVTNNATNWPAATLSGSTNQKQNGTVFTFPTPTGSWGTANAVGFYDAVTNGNLLYWADLAVANAIVSGNVVSFQINSLTLSEA